MYHEIFAFLLHKDLYAQYAHYDIRELLSGSRVAQTVYKTIRNLQESADNTRSGNKSIDEINLLAKDQLPEREHTELQAFLGLVGEVDRAKYSETGIKKAFENAQRRNLAAYLAASALPALTDGELLDVPGILQKLEEGSNRLYASDNRVDYGEHTDREVTPAKTIPSYIRPLDAAIEGGLSPGQLATFVGWPGIGKTLLLHQSAALAYYHGHHAGVITLEISKEEACRRIDMFFGRGKEDLGATFNERMAEAKSRGGRLTIIDSAADVCTPDTVQSILESARRRGTPIDTLYIDYADLMETGRNLEDYNELGEIYKRLRRVAAKFGVPIWTASQAVRGSLGKRWLDMGDIADSFKKARIADLIITINQTYDEQETGDLRLYVAKSRRNKGHPKIHLKADMDRMAVL